MLLHDRSTCGAQQVRRDVRKLRTIFGRENAPNEPSVRRLISNFEETGSVKDINRQVRILAGCSLRIIESDRDNSHQLGFKSEQCTKFVRFKTL